MKQSRRHELKTNELSIWLQQTYEAAARYRNYLIGGVMVVVFILIVALYAQSRRHQARENAWKEYYELMGARPSQKPEVMDQARSFAANHADESELGPRSLLLVANLASAYVAELDPIKEGPKRLALLKEARDNFNRVIDGYADQPKLVAQARLGLASVLESLVLVGEASVEDVRKQYQALQQMPDGLYAETAKEHESTLEDRLRPLKLVATRPAEPTATAPATRPASAPATLPAEAPATAPVAATTQPAGRAATQPTP